MSRYVRLLQKLRVFAVVLLVLGSSITSLDVARAAVPPNPPGGVSGSYGLDLRVPAVDGARGTMTYTYPFALPVARGDAQPTLGLTYSSELGTGDAGEGWSLGLPNIERAPLSGWPKYFDDGVAGNEDRYTFSGQPLTYVCGGVGGDSQACSNMPAVLGQIPSWATGWRYYRLQVDTIHARFFLSPSEGAPGTGRRTWRVQFRGGEVMEFGVPLTTTFGPLENEGGSSVDPDDPTQVPFRWNLVRHYDRRGARNLAVYSWVATGKPPARHVLRHIFYTPPAANWASPQLDEFAYHVQLFWENPTYQQNHYAQQDKARPYARLRRVAVASKTWSASGPREFVRAYNLTYLADRTVPGTATESPLWNRSFLHQIKAEPRCAATEISGLIPETNCTVPPPIVTTLEYQPATLNVGATMVQSNLAPSGFASGNLPYPEHTIVADVNRDGLPDIIQGWPQNFEGGNYRRWLTECPEPNDNDDAVDVWFHIRPGPGGPPGGGPPGGGPPGGGPPGGGPPGGGPPGGGPPGSGSNPQLVCHYTDDPFVIRNARIQSAYVNRGKVGGGLSLQHHCLDAGDGGSNGLVKYQITPPGTTVPSSNPVAFLSQWGAEAFGPFGDSLLLWSQAGFRGFAIREPIPNTGADTAFCPQASTNPQYPSLRWTKKNSNNWQRDPPLPADPAVAFVDIDGDGYPDRLGTTGAAGSHNGLREVRVQLTRRLSKLQTLFQSTITGPALIPFTSSPEAAPSAAGPFGAAPGTLVIYADINGDGLVDLVKSDPTVDGGIPHVRPGDGRGRFGCEPGRPDCNLPGLEGSGEWLGNAYRINVADAAVPWPLELTDQVSSPIRRSYFHDVTGDGLADLIAWEPAADHVNGVGRVKLWVNVDGNAFRCAVPGTDCTVATLPPDPVGPQAPKVSFADFDANGVDDIVLLRHSAAFHHSFVVTAPQGGTSPRAPRPGLLKRIRNGTGADVEISYSTIQELDRAAQDNDPSSFLAPWRSHVPSVIPVVTEINVKDTSQVTNGTGLAEPFAINRTTRYAYRNPAYDVWERSFKGFARVRAEHASGEFVETRYWFGRCSQGTTDGCAETSDDHDDRGFTGVPIRVDRYSGAADFLRWFSSTTYQYEAAGRVIPNIVPPGTTPDRRIQFPRVEFKTDYLYDTNIVSSALSDGADLRPFDEQPRHVEAGMVVLRTKYTYQSEGILQNVTEYGRIPDTGPGGPSPSPDSTISYSSLPSAFNATRCLPDWACVSDGVMVVEGSEVLREITFLRNSPQKDIVAIYTKLSYPNIFGPAPSLYRPQQAPADIPQTPSGARTLADFEVDEFGNTTKHLGGLMTSERSCTEVVPDDAYRQFPRTVTRWSGHHCSGTPLRTETTFDRGLQLLTSQLAPDQRSITMVDYDGFGHLTTVSAPAPDGTPFTTELAIEAVTQLAAPTPHVRISRRAADLDYVQSVEIFNGLGEHVLGFDEADPSADGAPWIARDWTERDADGQVTTRRRSWFHSGADPAAIATTGATVTPAGSRLLALYDTFGRVTETFDEGLGPALVTARYNHTPLKVDIRDAEQAKASGPFVGLFTTVNFDGHGRRSSVVSRNLTEISTTTMRYYGTGEPRSITRERTGSPTYERSMTWDSLGRLVRNIEPNTSDRSKNFVGWTYLYDDNNQLIATSDARGCGKDLYYDALGRPLAEDFWPCDASQAAHTAPDPDTGDGTEVFYRYDAYEPGQVAPDPTFDDRPEFAFGRLVSIQDRGAHTRLNYDARGRVRRTTRRIVKPGAPSASLGDRFASNVFTQRADYDLGDRLTTRSTGLADPELLVAGASSASYEYTARGVLSAIAGSYGNLVTGMKYDARGNLLEARYGDLAATRVDRVVDGRDRLGRLHVHRPNPPSLWSTGGPNYTPPPTETSQLDLVDERFTLDDVSNPTRIADLSSAAWPAGVKPVIRDMEYDGLYRLKRIDYAHGADEHIPAFEPEAGIGDRRPVAERRGASRPTQQLFTYDFLGNVTSSEDNEGLRYDRSLGAITNGRNVGGFVEGPNQLVDAAGIHASYDAAGDLIELTVARDSCWPAMPKCSHRFRYEWDEAGSLTRARRWDFLPGAVPSFDPGATADWDLHYAYSAGGRVLTTSEGVGSGVRHTLDVFDTLRIQTPVYQAAANEYRVRVENETGFVGGIGRVFYDEPGALPQATGSARHVYLHVGDHLGSTGLVLDKDSGEVVERATYQAFGSVEADFRPARWSRFRAENKFTGKEEDIEVGLTYFGARYYQAHLGRWASADPLTIHGLGSDLNPYAYVSGRVMSHIDPFGLEPIPSGARDIQHHLGGWSAVINGQLEVGTYDSPAAIRDHQRPSREGRDFDRSPGFEGPLGPSFDRQAASSAGGFTFPTTSRASQLAAGGYPNLAKRAEANEREDFVLNVAAPVALSVLTGAGAIPRSSIGPAEGGLARGGPLAGRNMTILPGGSGNAIAGHGGLPPGAGRMTVPPGTTLSLWTIDGATIPNNVGLLIEAGDYGAIAADPFLAAEVEGAHSLLPGATLPNYTISPPTGLTVLQNSRMVHRPTSLNQVVGPNMGHIDCAFCLE